MKVDSSRLATLSWVLLLLVFLLAVGASFYLGGEFVRRTIPTPSGKPDTVTVTKWLPAPIPEPETKPVMPKIVYLPRPVPVHDTLAVHDTTTVRDSVLVEVPIVEKTYPGDNYKVTIRGFEPELVDIWIRHDETTITVPYRKHWSVTVGPQLGVGITPKGWQPYAGAGVTFGYSF